MATISPQLIKDDLRGVFRGPLAFDAPTRTIYAGDASPFEVLPAGVATPLDEADLQTLVQYAHEHALPLVPRGAGTGLAGGALGGGLVVDLSVHLRRIVDVGPDWVRVQAGVGHEVLAQALAPHRRRLAAEPAHTGVSTIGGMVASNAAGPGAFRHGSVREHVRGVEVLWNSGEAATVLTPGLAPAAVGYATPPERGPRFIELRALTSALLAEHRELIQLARPATRLNRCGYVLHDVLRPAGLDLARLLTGSEGTLGILTQITLATQELPGAVGQVVLGWPTVEAATLAGLTLWTVDGLVSCELFDQRLIALTRTQAAAEGVGPVAPEVGAALLITVECEGEAAALSALRDALGRCAKRGPFVVLAGPSTAAPDRARVRRFRDAALGPVSGGTPGPRPLTGLEDVAVPAEELPKFLHELRALLQGAGITASHAVNVLTGQVQTRPWLDLNSEADRARVWPLAEAVHGRVLALGGTVSAAHGTGLARTPWVEKQYGPLWPVFAELKRIYDPKSTLNPGNVVGPDPSRPAWPLRPGPAPAEAPTADGVPAPLRFTPLLLWEPGELAAQLANCNGCGQCRTRTAGRMCPAFRALGTEAASPRSKPALVRQALAGPDASTLTTDEAKAVAALCVHCKMCPSECRGKVDVPRLALEIKAAYHAERGLDRTDWTLARIESFVQLGGKFAFTANLLLRLRPSRWLIEKLLGLSRRRRLPRFTHRTFLNRAWRLGLTRLRRPGTPAPGRKVAYFVDLFANAHDPSIGLATAAVLKHAGVEVHVPWRQRACGLAPLVQGDVDSARDIARYNVRTLASLVREGYRVVCSEPTAALTITQEYPRLLADPDARLVAAHTTELTAYLWELHQAGELPTPAGRLDANLGHHVPCHMKALGGTPAAPDLLALIPGVQAYAIDAGCSGMAGPYGLRADAYDASLAAGQALFAELDRPRVIYGSTECSACRLQMQEASGKRTLHPVQYLALAYGLLPELRARLARPLGARVSD